MKDPLHRQQTPYEILGLSHGATPAEIDKAFKLGLVKRVNVQKLTGAKVALERPVDRAVLDLLHYDDAISERLVPDPRGSESLAAANRSATASAWEAQLRRSFPDYAIAHALAVLWYWWAFSESERAGEESRGSSSVRELWRTAIGYWAMVIAGDDFWESQRILPQEITRNVQHALEERLAADIHRFAQAGGPEAETFHKLELTLKTEIRTARALAAADIRANRSRLACGAILLERLGLLEKIRAQIDQAIEASPSNGALIATRDALSPFSAINALIDGKQYQAALDEIDRLPAAERDSKEVWRLEAQALFERGRQEVSLGRFDAALDLWKKALSRAQVEAVKRTIHDELVETVHARAAALQSKQQDEAIRLLEKALKVVHSTKLDLTLGEILCTRGIARILEGQKKAERDGKASPEVVESVEKGLQDLARAKKLGSARAAEQAEIASGILEMLKGGGSRPVVSNVPPAVRSLLTQAAAAAEKSEWTSAIDLLRRALRETSHGSEAAATIRKHLATMLANRAIGAANSVMGLLQRDNKSPSDLKMFVTVLDAARKDLREAAELDSSSEFVRDNLRQIEEMFEQLGPMADVVRGTSVPAARPAGSYRLVTDTRHVVHTIIVAAIFLLAMFVALSAGPGSKNTSPGIYEWVMGVRHGSPMGGLGHWAGVILGWPAWLALFGANAYLFGVICGTRWARKDGFAKFAEIVAWIFALAYLPAIALHVTRDRADPPAAVAAAEAPGRGGKAPEPTTSTQVSAATETKPPPTATPAAMDSRAPSPPASAAATSTPSPARDAAAVEVPAWLQGEATPAGILETLAAVETASGDEARLRAQALSDAVKTAPTGARNAALFCAAAAWERSGEVQRAKEIYRGLAAADWSLRRSAEFRLAVLDGAERGDLEERYVSLQHQDAAAGLFHLGGRWTSSDTRRAALQGLMSNRAHRASIRLFNYLRSKSFFPPEYAYLFILLALVLVVKVLELPLLVTTAKLSLAIPKLRGEYARLKSQYAGDAAGFTREVTSLYKRHGINPSAGCLKVGIDLAFVVWALVTLKNYVPQLALDGSRFLWAGDITSRDAGVLVMWGLAGMLMLFLTPKIEQGQTGQLACGGAAIFAIVAGAAWYWSWPAWLMIFWTGLTLMTAFVHFVMIGVLATRS